MVKFANKCKGKKSNRKTISVKKTIDRNVKNHKKKLKKEVRKMKAMGILKKSLQLFFTLKKKKKKKTFFVFLNQKNTMSANFLTFTHSKHKL